MQEPVCVPGTDGPIDFAALLPAERRQMVCGNGKTARCGCLLWGNPATPIHELPALQGVLTERSAYLRRLTGKQFDHAPGCKHYRQVVRHPAITQCPDGLHVRLRLTDSAPVRAPLNAAPTQAAQTREKARERHARIGLRTLLGDRLDAVGANASKSELVVDRYPVHIGALAHDFARMQFECPGYVVRHAVVGTATLPAAGNDALLLIDQLQGGLSRSRLRTRGGLALSLSPAVREKADKARHNFLRFTGKWWLIAIVVRRGARFVVEEAGFLATSENGMYVDCERELELVRHATASKWTFQRAFNSDGAPKYDLVVKCGDRWTAIEVVSPSADRRYRADLARKSRGVVFLHADDEMPLIVGNRLVVPRQEQLSFAGS